MKINSFKPAFQLFVKKRRKEELTIAVPCHESLASKEASHAASALGGIFLQVSKI